MRKGGKRGVNAASLKGVYEKCHLALFSRGGATGKRTHETLVCDIGHRASPLASMRVVRVGKGESVCCQAPGVVFVRALHIAVVQGELAVVRQLIHLLECAGRSLDIYNNLRQTPLHLAVITQQASMVEALLRAGSDPSALDRNGQTALHLCCEYDHPACLSVVLSLPSSVASLEMKNFQGLSPLHVAVLHGHRDLVSMLLGAGADVNTTDIKSGQSSLILAVESNNTEMVRFLIESGCDVNRPSYSSNTALHSACARGQADVVRVLLKSGADSSLKNYHNDTPVMLAKNKKIADILRGRGSSIRLPDQHIGTSSSPHGSNLMTNGSSSPSHSRDCSPSTMPPTPHSSVPHSPRTPPMLAFPFY
ncbi:B-cell lymphoma 3 protein isoform X3 [Vanacampus margaritifer]